MSSIHKSPSDLYEDMVKARITFTTALKADPTHTSQPVVNAKNAWHVCTIDAMKFVCATNNTNIEFRRELYAELCDWHLAMQGTVVYFETHEWVYKLLHAVAFKM